MDFQLLKSHLIWFPSGPAGDGLHRLHVTRLYDAVVGRQLHGDALDCRTDGVASHPGGNWRGGRPVSAARSRWSRQVMCTTFICSVCGSNETRVIHPVCRTRRRPCVRRSACTPPCRTALRIGRWTAPRWPATMCPRAPSLSPICRVPTGTTARSPMHRASGPSAFWTPAVAWRSARMPRCRSAPASGCALAKRSRAIWCSCWWLRWRRASMCGRRTRTQRCGSRTRTRVARALLAFRRRRGCALSSDERDWDVHLAAQQWNTVYYLELKRVEQAFEYKWNC